MGQNASKELVVSGYVFDAQNGEIMIGAYLYDPSKTRATTTNAKEVGNNIGNGFNQTEYEQILWFIREN